MTTADMTAADLAEHLAGVFQERAAELTAAWARDLPPELRAKLHPYPDPQDPQVLRGIACCLTEPKSGMQCAVSLFERARQWGEVAESRSVAAEELLDAYGALDALLWKVAAHQIERLDVAPAPDALLLSMRRLHETMQLTARAAFSAYLGIYRGHMEADADRLRGFNRMASHELKTPLSVIHGAAELLSEDGVVETPESRAHFLEMIQQSAGRLATLLDDIIALTTAERVPEASEVQPLDLEDVFANLQDALRAEAARQNVRLEKEGSLPLVKVDGAALQLALTNLVANAIRYADPRKPERRVCVRATTGVDGSHVLSVQDNGLGIPADAQPRIFERFYRAERDRAVAGTGLGLAIVKELVERWDGRVWFESQEDIGTTFHLTVPGANGEES